MPNRIYGLFGAAAAIDVALICQPWHAQRMDATLVLGQQGRLVIPVEIRVALGLDAGDRLHLHVTGQRRPADVRAQAVAELRGLAASVPKSRSLVDELLAERRLAAAAE